MFYFTIFNVLSILGSVVLQLLYIILYINIGLLVTFVHDVVIPSFSASTTALTLHVVHHDYFTALSSSTPFLQRFLSYASTAFATSSAGVEPHALFLRRAAVPHNVSRVTSHFDHFSQHPPQPLNLVGVPRHASLLRAPPISHTYVFPYVLSSSSHLVPRYHSLLTSKMTFKFTT